MNRLLKRHKRQTSRAQAQAQAKVSEPDVRTSEELRAAREASRPAGGWRISSDSGYFKSSTRHQAAPAGDSRTKGDG